MTNATDGMTAVMERALSRSAEALSRFLGDRMLRPAHLALTNHKLVELPVVWGSEDTAVAAIALEVGGDLDGYLVLTIPMESLELFLKPLLGELDVDADEELADSALGELGNVVGSAFLNDLADRFSLRIKPSPPAVVRDMIGALLATLAAALAADERQELPVVRAQLTENGNGEECNAYLLWIPGHSDLERLERLA